MKKLVSVLTAVVIAMTMFVAGATTAMAVESPTAPTKPTTTETTQNSVGPDLTINGDHSTDVTFKPGDKDNEFIIDYTGDGDLEGWENNFDDLGLVEGVDYVITVNDDGSITIELITDKAKDAWNNGDMKINAIVKGDTTTETTKKNDSPNSPNTGISTTAIAGTVAVLGAGVAVLVATRKKDAE